MKNNKYANLCLIFDKWYVEVTFKLKLTRQTIFLFFEIFTKFKHKEEGSLLI